MQHNGSIKASERAEPEQLRGVKLTHGDQLLPAPGRAAAAHETPGHGVERRAASALRRRLHAARRRYTHHVSTSKHQI